LLKLSRIHDSYLTQSHKVFPISDLKYSTDLFRLLPQARFVGLTINYTAVAI